jgi:hypothetical protein
VCKKVRDWQSSPDGGAKQERAYTPCRMTQTRGRLRALQTGGIEYKQCKYTATLHLLYRQRCEVFALRAQASAYCNQLSAREVRLTAVLRARDPSSGSPKAAVHVLGLPTWTGV